jgi:hypothetical protein
LSVNDIVEVIVYDVFSVADTVSKADGGVFDGNVTMAGNLSVDGNLDVTGSLDMSDANLTNVGSVQLDSISGDADTNTSITFSGSDVITVATGGSTAFTVDASQDVNLSGSLTFADNEKAIFGAGSGDLEIYSDGTYSRIMETGGLFLVVDTNGSQISLTADNSKNMGTFIRDGAVQLFFSNAQKFSTTNTGIDVTGTATMDGLTVDGSATLQNILNIGGTDPQIRTDTSDGSDNKTLWLGGGGVAYDWNRGGFFYAQGNEAGGHVGITAGAVSGGSIKFTTGTAERMRIDSSGNVGIGTTSPQDIIDIRGGASSSFIFGTGVNSADSTLTLEFRDRYGTSGFGQGQIASFIKNVRDGSTGNYDLTFGTNTGTGTNASERMRIDSSGKVGIGTTSPSDKIHLAEAGATSAFARFSNSNVSNGWSLGAATSGRFQLTQNGVADRIIVDTSGNVGIGTSSGTAPLEVSNSATNSLRIHRDFATNSASSATIRFAGDDSAGNVTDYAEIRSLTEVVTNGSEAGALLFGTRSSGSVTERMRIDSSGNVLVGTTTVVAKFNAVGSNFGTSSETTAGANAGIAYFSKRTSSGIQMRFDQSGTVCGDITTNGSAVSYGSNSDYRLKENVVEMTGAIDRVKQLSPKRFNFITDSDTTVDGFLAHEAQTVVAEAVTGTHNEVDDDGNAVMQGIDQSKLVPLLTGALKEAIVIIEDLQARIVALENAE